MFSRSSNGTHYVSRVTFRSGSTQHCSQGNNRCTAHTSRTWMARGT